MDEDDELAGFEEALDELTPEQLEELLGGPLWVPALLVEATIVGQMLQEAMQAPDERMPEQADEIGTTLTEIVEILQDRAEPIAERIDEEEERLEIPGLRMFFTWCATSFSQAATLLEQAHDLREANGSWEEIGELLASALFYAASTICYLDVYGDLTAVPPGAPEESIQPSSRPKPHRARAKKTRRGKKRQ